MGDAYIHSLKDVPQGNKAFPVRKALESLLIKEHMNWSHEETVEQIKENPYLQYFIVLSAFQEKAPFDASLMARFSKRLDAPIIHQVNEWIVEAQTQKRIQGIKVMMMLMEEGQRIRHLLPDNKEGK